MIIRCLACVSLVALAFGSSPATPAALAQEPREVRSEVERSPSERTGSQQRTTREESESGTVERTVVEEPSVNGGSAVLSEVEDETVRVGTETTRRTRREFFTDANGRQALVSTVDEQRVDRQDGRQTVVREFTESDLNGRSRAVRREREETIPVTGGIFTTRIEVSEPPVNGGGFVPTERVEQRERRDGDQVLELQRTTYSDPTGRGAWEALEQRVVQRDYADGRVDTVESVYRADGTGNLVESDRIVGREWVGAQGREHRTEEIYTTDVPGEARSAEPRLFQQVDIVRTSGAGGGSSATRTVKEQRGGGWRVVERVIERARPDGRGGTVIERETQQLDVNGQLQTVNVTRERESVR